MVPPPHQLQWSAGERLRGWGTARYGRQFWHTTEPRAKPGVEKSCRQGLVGYPVRSLGQSPVALHFGPTKNLKPREYPPWVPRLSRIRSLTQGGYSLGFDERIRQLFTINRSSK